VGLADPARRNGRLTTADRPTRHGETYDSPAYPVWGRCGTIQGMATPRRARVEATGERSVVTPLELFFDLVFVFALTQVTDLMAEDPTVGHVFRGVLMLGVLWWCWTGYAWLGNIARADEGIIRIAMFASMGGVFVIAITIPEAFDDGPGGLHGPTVFAVCYLVVRLVHVFMFWIISREDREFRGQILRWIPSLVVATALLLVAGQTTGVTQTSQAPTSRATAGGWARRATSPSGTG
jgi:low temperature requirement protein LtrA